MLYRFLQFLMKLSLQAHYLEIKFYGLNKVPKKGPLLIASTHPNSFLDAIILACYINRPLHFLARSDVFNAKWSNFILRQLNLIPIYRLQEGHENLSKNERTFSECNDILSNDGAILIFAEGISLTDMKLRPLKKGLARIAFGFLEDVQFQKKCQVVPIAINYDRPTEFRSKINVGLGQTILINKLKEEYEQNKNSAYSKLNQQIFEELQSHTIEVEEKDYMVYKAMVELDSGFEQNSLSRKITIANRIREIAKADQNAFNKLKDSIDQAFNILKSNRLNFRKLKVNQGFDWLIFIATILLAPLLIASFLLNSIPLILTKLICNRFVKLDEFYASVRLVLGSLLWIIWAFLLTTYLLPYSIFFLFTPLVLFGGVHLYLFFYEHIKYMRSSVRLGKLKKQSSKYDELQTLIKNIYKQRNLLDITPKSN